MQPLLRLALLLCPPSFRREYEAQIRIDADGARWSGSGNLLFLCGNVAWNGMLLHLEMLARNTVFAARSLAHARTYAAVSIVTIALAIGANLAVAGVLDGIMLRPLPYPHPEQIYAVSQHGEYGGWSYLNVHEYAAKSTTIAQIGIAADDSQTLLGRGRPAHLDGKEVDGGYFAVLGLQPKLGRFIGAADMRKNVAVISDAAYRGYFDANPGVIGKRMNLSGTLYTIVGVAPPQFRDPTLGGLQQSAYWIPDDMPAQHVRARGDSAAFARLRPGASAAAATADLHRIVGELDRRYPNPALIHPVPGTLVALLPLVVGPVAPLLWLLYAAVTVLLLLACANVVNLALVRAAARERELVVRSALGASRITLAAQLCTESSMLSAAGGAAGALLGWVCIDAFAAFGAQLLPRWDAIRLDVPLVAYAVVVVAFVAIATGVLPLLWMAHDVATALKFAGRGGDRSGSKRMRSGLAIAEIALALAVVACAGLIVRSFVTLTHAELGFDSANVLVIDNLSLPMSSLDFPMRDRRISRLVNDLDRIPGVTAAAVSHWAPFMPFSLRVPANVPARAAAPVQVSYNDVTPEYFRALHIPIVAGRVFTADDTLESQPVAVVSAGLARRYFGTAIKAVGGTVYPKMDIGSNSVVPRTIVGVVGDARTSYAQPAVPTVYAATAQFPLVFTAIVRTNGRVSGLANAIDEVFARRIPDAPPPRVMPYADLLANDAMNSRVAALLFGGFAIVALLLALAGVYAVTAYGVEQRTQEFGIRRAIGATNATVVREVLAGALRFGVAGIVAGLVLSALCARSLSALLFATSPLDPATFGAVVLIVLACTLFAAAVPAMRAARMQPGSALRYE